MSEQEVVELTETVDATNTVGSEAAHADSNVTNSDVAPAEKQKKKPGRKPNPDKNKEKPAKPEKVVVEKDERNGVCKPRPGTKTRIVWDILDELEAGALERFNRSQDLAEEFRLKIVPAVTLNDVISAADKISQEKGLGEMPRGTASTQRQRRREYLGLVNKSF